jgi:hypothetical protein
VASSVIFKKNAQRKRTAKNGRKFAQSGHPEITAENQSVHTNRKKNKKEKKTHTKGERKNEGVLFRAGRGRVSGRVPLPA